MRATADGLNTPFPHAFSTSREAGNFYVDNGKLTQPLIPGLAVSNEIDAAFASFDRQRNGAFILLADGFFRNQSEPLIKLAARQ
jgi:hypothetical protein